MGRGWEVAAWKEVAAMSCLRAMAADVPVDEAHEVATLRLEATRDPSTEG